MRSPRTSGRRILGAALLVGLLGVGSAPARAMQNQAPAGETAGMEREVARLRAALDRANAEVAVLKKSGGVGSDYRLRQRLADAEALARQLTRAETQLRGRTGQPTGPAALPVAPPVAAPGDGPVELEAKADLLVDEARRLASHADTLMRTAGQLRDRQTLRRRAAQFERDPFASLDAPRRAMVFGGKSNDRPLSTPTEGAPATPGKATDNAGGPSATTGGNPGAAPVVAPMTPQTPTPPPPSTIAPTAPPAAPPTTTATGGATAVAPPPGRSVTPVQVAQPTSPPASDVSVQIRTLLDPATLSEIQRLERGGQSTSDPAALEKVAAALRQRARSLEQQARTIRPKK